MLKVAEYERENKRHEAQKKNKKNNNNIRIFFEVCIMHVYRFILCKHIDFCVRK